MLSLAYSTAVQNITDHNIRCVFSYIILYKKKDYLKLIWRSSSCYVVCMDTDPTHGLRKDILA